MANIFQYFKDHPERMPRLKDLPEEERKAEIDLMRRVGELAPVNEGIFTEAAQGAGNAFLQTARGFGSTVQELGLGNGVYDYFDEAMAERRHWEPDPEYSTLSLNPGHIARTLSSGLTQTAMTAPVFVAGTAAGGPVGGALAGGAVVFTQLYGDNVKEYRERLAPLGYSESEIKSIAAGRTLVDSAVEVALGSVPAAGRLLSGGKFASAAARDSLAKSAIKHAMGRFGRERVVNALYHVGKGAVEEGAEEVVQEFNGYVWRAVAGDDSDAPGLRDYAESFAGGAWPGGLFGGAEAVGGHGNPSRSGRDGGNIEPAAWRKHYEVSRDQSRAGKIAEAVPSERIQADELAVVEPKSRAAHVMADIAGELGLDVRYFVPKTENASQLNGVTAPDGTLYLDASAINQNPMQSLGHEFYHYLEQNEHYKDLADGWRSAVAEAMNDNGRRELGEIGAQYGSDGNPMAEFSADRLGEMFLSPEMWQRAITLAEARQAGFGGRVLLALKKFIRAVKRNLLKIRNPAARNVIGHLEQIRETAAQTLAEFKTRQAGMLVPGETAPAAAMPDYQAFRDAKTQQEARAGAAIDRMRQPESTAAPNPAPALPETRPDTPPPAAEQEDVLSRARQEIRRQLVETGEYKGYGRHFHIRNTEHGWTAVEHNQGYDTTEGGGYPARWTQSDAVENIVRRVEYDHAAGLQQEAKPKPKPEEKRGRELFGPEELAEFDRLGIDVAKVTARYREEALQQLHFRQQSEKELASPHHDELVKKREEHVRDPQGEYPTLESVEKGRSPEQRLRELIRSDDSAMKKNAAMKKLAEDFGLSVKQIQERIESVIVQLVREINAEAVSDAEKWAKLLDLYRRQPNLSMRTSTSIRNQAYSTPAPLAWLLQKRIGIEHGRKIYEPTAGTGMLVAIADPAKTHVNEIERVRLGILNKRKFAAVTTLDALTYKPEGVFDQVIMNPPFGEGSPKEFHGFTLSKLDHRIAANALETLADDGRAAIIVGANTESARGTGRASYPDFVFMNYLYNRFNVRDNWIVDGDLYRKQGATFPVRVITLDGRRSFDGEIRELAPKEVEKIADWDTLYEKLKGELEHVISGGERGSDSHSDRILHNRADVEREAPGKSGATSVGAGTVLGEADRGNGRSGTDRRMAEERLPERRDTAGQRDGRLVAEPERRNEPELRGDGRSGGTELPADSGVVSGTQPGRDGASDGGRRGRERTAPVPAEFTRHEEVQPVRRDIEPVLPEGRDSVSRQHDVVKAGKEVGAFHSEYIPASKGAPLDTVVPRYMAKALTDSLNRLQNRVGNVDAYVASELGYASVEEMHNGLGAEQVDGVALAIDAIRHDSSAIIGDQTGIGKGRQCAALIRWAQKHGKLPIFFTKMPKLFTDMYRDGLDIGSEFHPLLVASKPSEANILDGDGRVVVKVPGDKRYGSAWQSVREGKNEYDSVFITYSQINTGGNEQQSFITQLAGNRDCLIILDEAHEAAGESNTGLFFRGGTIPPKKKGGSSASYHGILNDAPVVYVSATFAKNPDNMPLYFKTNLRKAASNTEALAEAVRQGGIPLQQVISQALATAGQLIRRERDFSGLDIKPNVTEPKNWNEVKQRYDRVAGVLREIVRYSNSVRSAVKKSGNYASANTREDKAVQMQSFASIAHNYIAQLLLASKTDLAVERALEAHRNGRKPIIVLMNTMESSLSEYVKENGIQSGDTVNMKFSDLLFAAMERMHRVKQKKSSGGEAETIVISPEKYGLGAEHERMAGLIRSLDGIDLPISPIDRLKQKLAEAGLKVGELTGRTATVDYSSGDPVLRNRPDTEKNKNRLVNAFNSGELDALILNSSGSTGLSLHASEKFKDQKQRKMIMIQPSLDINVVQQTFGRVLRSGQVVMPEYEILATPLAAEKRPMMVLSRKLKSLNANTTANDKGAVELGIDFLNKYGDEVAAEYIRENPEIADMAELKHPDGETDVPEDYMRSLAGKLALLPDKRQHEIFDDLQQRYIDHVDYLKKIGEYDLEIQSHDDWDVETAEASTLEPGDPNGSVFEQPVKLEAVTLNEKRNIPSLDEVMELRKGNGLGTRSEMEEKLKAATSPMREAIDKIDQAWPGRDEAFIADRKAGNLANLTAFENWIRTQVKSILSITRKDTVFTGVITNFKIAKPGAQNPAIASKFVIEFTVADSARTLRIPFSEIRTGKVGVSSSSQGNEVFTGEKRTVRVPRYLLTGNLVKALEFAGRGNVVTFKRRGGATDTAVLMPKSWEPGLLKRDPRNEFPSANQALSAYRTTPLATVDGIMQITHHGGSTLIETPKTKREGGKYYTSKAITDITGDFHVRGDRMIVELKEWRDGAAQAEKLIRHLYRSGVILKKRTESGKMSLARKPKSVEEFRAMPSHPLPEKMKFRTVKELYDIYKREYLGQTIRTVSGHTMTFKPGHFFRLISKMLPGERKGMIAKAANAADAIRMIENGEIGFSDISGFQQQRAEHIDLFKDVITDADFVYPDLRDKVVFGKKYAGMKGADGFLAVTMEIDRKGNLGILSFHPRSYTDTLLEKKEIQWMIARPSAHANDAGGVAAGEHTAVVSKHNIDDSGEKSSGKLSLARRRQVNPVREDGPARKHYQESLDESAHESISAEELARLASQRIDAYGGIRGMLKAVAEKEFAFGSDVSMKVGQMLLNSSEYRRAVTEGSPDAKQVADGFLKAQVQALEDLYQSAGTETAKALAARRIGGLNLNDIDSIQAYVNARLGRIPDANRRSRIIDRVRQKTGIDITELPRSLAGDRQMLDEVLRALMSESASKFDKLYEYWIDAILSGPPTHAANFLGNTANLAVELGPQRLVEAAINRIARRGDAAAGGGEFRAMWGEFARSFPAAKAAFRDAFLYETLTSEGKLEHHGTAIGGRLGRIVRLPVRFLRASDEFSKALIVPAETAAYAYREGKAQGLTGKRLQTYIGEQLDDPRSRAQRKAVRRARELTFQQEPGAIAKGLIHLRNSNTLGGHVLKFLLPFIKTPANILDASLRKSPLGTFGLAKEAVDVLRGRRQVDDLMIRHAAEQLLAWSAILAVWSLAGGDDDDPPYITGSAAPYGSTEGMFKGRHAPPFSIRIGDTYYSYKRIEPFASGLALIVDGINAVKAAKSGQDMTEVLSKLVMNTAKQAVSEKSYLDGIGSIVKFFDDPERNLAREGGNFLASWIPNAVRTTANAFDDNVRDFKSRKRGAAWWLDQFTVTAARAGLPELMQPKLDYFGREIPKDAGSGLSGVMWRIAAPVYTREADTMDAAERLLWRYNQRNPDEAYWPGIPSYLSTAGGKASYIEGADYTAYAKEAGQLAHKMILRAIKAGQLDTYNPAEEDIRNIRKIFTKARKTVREKFRQEGKFRR